MSAIFDEDNASTSAHRATLMELLGQDGYRQARAGVVDQFFTPSPVVDAVRQVLAQAGVRGGQGLEPGCGTGVFLDVVPGARMTGVEVDATTAAVAQALHPEAVVRHEGYESTPTTHLFDFVVGNVPFGEVRLHDPAHNPGRHSMHNHFIIKALAQTKPGGYVAVITSHYTLDALNPAARRDMYERADLVAGVRLPSSTFTSTTGTQVVSDLLVFRVRREGEEAAPFTWERASRHDLPSSHDEQGPARVVVNDAVVSGQVAVLGSMVVGPGRFGATTLRVSSAEADDGALRGQIVTVLSQALRQARERGLEYAPAMQALTPAVVLDDDVPVGTLRHTGEEFTQRTAGGWEVVHVPRTQRAELEALLNLRDRTRALLDTEQSTLGDSPDLSRQRAELAGAYEEYTASFGPLNRTSRHTRVRRGPDGEPVESVSYRYPPVMRVFRKDPASALTRAIEVYDEDTGVAEPAALLSRRQVFAAYEPKGADSAADAVAISMAYKGHVDPEYCGYLLGISDAQQVRQVLGELVFDTPDGSLVAREEYLSGNVREKLGKAQEAVDAGAPLQANVDALRAVMPKDLGVADVVPSVGATWVPPTDYAAFLEDLVGGRPQVTYNPVDGWKVSAVSAGVKALSVYGSQQVPAGKVLESMLNARPIKVMTTDDDGNTVLDVQATEVARGHAERIEEAFSTWLFRDPERTRRLLTEYNRRFNSLVPRSYDDAGRRLDLPGLAQHFTLREHQKAAVARMVAEPTTGLFHEVGAGKTLEMVCGVMEQRRLGLVRKPLVVVPNHMLAQFEREWLQAYPAARLLTAESTALSKEESRTLFMARATTSEWDAIICTQGAFERLPVRPQTQDAYERRELDTLEEWMASSDDRTSVRQAEIRRANMASRLRREADERAARTDNGVTFEDLGVDYLVVDEAHYYKNLSTPTNTVGILTSSSARKCKDFEMKVDYLRRTYGRRVLTMATATPIANTMGEMWVMTHYLRPDLLEAAGLATFDAWATTFTSMQSKVEVNASGSLKVRQRISAFKNMPELMSMWATFADVKRREQLDLDVPALEKDGSGNRLAHVVTVDAGPAMSEFSSALLARGERLERGVDPHVDNYLALTSDARAVATDYRLLSSRSAVRALDGVVSPFGRQKIDEVAVQVARIYHDTKDRTYSDERGGISPVPGALQLVFCDQGTPKPGQWNLYDELKTQLVAAGVPAERIAFIHDAATSAQKDDMFARARSGAIAVLVGSTEKMGTGANMQRRAIALHHVTCPWRPCDITQREGRIIRQGNENPEVGIYRYVTEGSFDAFLWQSVERKVAFINQVMDGRVTDRTMDAVDISDTEADFAQVKAIASGNPLQMEAARLSNEVSALGRRSAQFKREQEYLKNLAPALERQERTMLERADAVEQVVDVVSRYDAFTMSIGGHTYTKRSEAAQALREALTPVMRPGRLYQTSRARAYHVTAIECQGVALTLVRTPTARTFTGDASRPEQWLLGAAALNRHDWYFGHHGAALTFDVLTAEGVGAIRRVENHLASLSTQATRMRQAAEQAASERAQALAQVGADNPWERRLAAARTQLAAVRAELDGVTGSQETQPQLAIAEQSATRTRTIFDIARNPVTPLAQAPTPTDQDTPAMVQHTYSSRTTRGQTL